MYIGFNIVCCLVCGSQESQLICETPNTKTKMADIIKTNRKRCAGCNFLKYIYLLVSVELGIWPFDLQSLSLLCEISIPQLKTIVAVR